MSDLILGSQTSLKKPKYLEGVIEQVKEFAGNAMMFFIGTPQTFKQQPKENLDTKLFNKLLKENNFDINNVYIHASYLINFGNSNNKNVFSTSIEVLDAICSNANYIKVKNIILHPGSAVSATKNESLKSLIKGIDHILNIYKDINIHLETMSGKGSEIGSTFEELKYVIDNSKFSDRIFICFDICHLFASGYDVKNNFDDVLNQFDQIIGLDKLKVLHLNDSLKPFNSKRDRHANIGKGLIGLKALKNIVHHPKLKNVVKLLETPYINGKPPYKEEIKLLK